MRWLDHVIAATPNFFASAQKFSNFSTSLATRLHSAIRNRKSKIEMSRQSDSNRRPADYKSAALPAELCRHLRGKTFHSHLPLPAIVSPFCIPQLKSGCNKSGFLPLPVDYCPCSQSPRKLIKVKRSSQSDRTHGCSRFGATRPKDFESMSRAALCRPQKNRFGKARPFKT